MLFTSAELWPANSPPKPVAKMCVWLILQTHHKPVHRFLCATSCTAHISPWQAFIFYGMTRICFRRLGENALLIKLNCALQATNNMWNLSPSIKYVWFHFGFLPSVWAIQPSLHVRIQPSILAPHRLPKVEWWMISCHVGCHLTCRFSHGVMIPEQSTIWLLEDRLDFWHTKFRSVVVCSLISHMPVVKRKKSIDCNELVLILFK